MLSFQRLDVYTCAIDFLALSTRLLGTTDADGARHYAIARGSAMECAAIIDALHVLRFLDDAAHSEAIGILARIVAMTTKLCR